MLLDCLAFVCAAIAASLFLAWGFFQPQSAGQGTMAVAATFGSSLVTSSIIGSIAFLPAFVAITLAEIFGWRSILYYLSVAGLIGFVAWNSDGAAVLTAARPGTTVALSAGFIGGFVYWLIAGRRAGCWKTR
ncbi:translation initiation factor IF-3 [Roseibium sp. RKSG952]|nr:translation initiation factor IF-3 [Roseibium sp. RKSG952]